MMNTHRFQATKISNKTYHCKEIYTDWSKYN